MLLVAMVFAIFPANVATPLLNITRCISARVFVEVAGVDCEFAAVGEAAVVVDEGAATAGLAVEAGCGLTGGVLVDEAAAVVDEAAVGG